MNHAGKGETTFRLFWHFVFVPCGLSLTRKNEKDKLRIREYRLIRLNV